MRAPVSLIGPKAATLLALAGLPGDVPRRRRRLRRRRGRGGVVLRAGADHWLALLDADAAPEACHALLEAGRSVGL